MTNATFPALELITSASYISPWNVVATLTTLNLPGSPFSFEIATAVDTIVSVDWGNGILVDYPSSTALTELSGQLAGDMVKIYGAHITSLNVDNKKLTALDVSGITGLKELFCSNNWLTHMDLWQNTLLETFDCSNNLLVSLTHLVSPVLKRLDCSHNELVAIDVLSTVMDYFNCSSNKFTFSTLPGKRAGWLDYQYAPQAPIPLKGQFGMSEEIDLSDQYTIGGNTSNYTWKTIGGVVLVNGTDYGENNGIFWFNRIINDSIYCEITNPSFPFLILTTSHIKITSPLPAIVLTTSHEAGSLFRLRLTTLNDETAIQVDWGMEASTVIWQVCNGPRYLERLLVALFQFTGKILQTWM
jgi:hypothetical protein